MAVAESEDKLASAKAQGQAQFDSIRYMVRPDWDAIALEAGWAPYRDKFNVSCWRDASDGATFAGTAEQLCEYHGIEEPDAVREDREQRIHEDALSVEVRSGWYAPGAELDSVIAKPTEYRILLCTGGPACQIIGELSEHGEPETARLQVQDWFTPWTDYRPFMNAADGPSWDSEPILLEYARCFYFGE